MDVKRKVAWGCPEAKLSDDVAINDDGDDW